MLIAGGRDGRSARRNIVRRSFNGKHEHHRPAS